MNPFFILSVSNYFRLFQGISIYFKVFPFISRYFHLFQSISIYFTVLLPKMIVTKRTNSTDAAFQALVSELDAELKIRDGDEHSFYAQFNKIDKIRHVVLAFDGDLPIGCGAVKHYSPDTMEIKRMFVHKDMRGKGVVSVVLQELETWCWELGYTRCILETGIKQPDAIRLYEKNNYSTIPNFGQYENAKNSVCFEKNLKNSV